VLNFGEWGNPNTDEYGNSGYGKPAANLRSVYNNYDINYLNAIVTATLILANRVVDDPPDKAKEFFFTLYFKDEDGDPVTGALTYKGGVLGGDSPNWDDGGSYAVKDKLTDVTAPDDSIPMTLTTVPDGSDTPGKEAGRVTFTLLHGQLIEIEVPAGEVRIVQQTGWPYATSFLDSEHMSVYVEGRDTGFRPIEAGDERRFDYYNGIDTTPPTGLNMGSPAAALPFTMIIGGLWLISRSITDIRRRRKTMWEA
jgi:hypothetical protein